MDTKGNGHEHREVPRVQYRFWSILIAFPNTLILAAQIFLFRILSNVYPYSIKNRYISFGICIDLSYITRNMNNTFVAPVSLTKLHCSCPTPVYSSEFECFAMLLIRLIAWLISHSFASLFLFYLSRPNFHFTYCWCFRTFVHYRFSSFVVKMFYDVFVPYFMYKITKNIHAIFIY